MKFVCFLLNVAVGVGMFFLLGYLIELFGADSWQQIAIFGGAAFLGLIFKNGGSLLSIIFEDIFHYALILASYSLVRFVAWSVLPTIDFNTFFKGLLLFFGSAILLGFLARFVILGLKAIIDFGAWGENPSRNMTRIAFAFMSLMSILIWIAGVVQLGLVGGLSILGLLVGLIPNEYVDAIVQSSTDATPDTSSAPVRYREEITLSNGVTLKEDETGMMMDDARHEWKKDSDGHWYDDGFRS